MRITNLILLFVFLFQNFTFSQVNGENIFEPKLSGKTFLYNSDLIGNQYYLNSWLKCDILLNNGLEVKDKNLRYNGYLDNFIWVNDNNQQVILEKDFISVVTMKNTDRKNLIFYKIWIKNSDLYDSTQVFAQLLSPGIVKLYAYRRVVVNKTDEYLNSTGTYKKAFLKYKPLYVFKMPNGKKIYISKINRKNIREAFQISKQELKTIQHENLLRLRNENDLIRATVFISNYLYPDSKK